MEEILLFISEYKLQGIIIGLATFLIIGLFHPIVIKGEYYFGDKIKWFFLVLGIIGFVGSIIVDNLALSSLLGVTSFSSFWGIKEVNEQKERVKIGWFTANPKKKYNSIKSSNEESTGEV